MFRSISCLFSLTRAGYVFARHGVFGLVDPSPLPAPARFGLSLVRLIERPETASSASAKLSAALNDLGPSYVKLGQFLATRRDLVGEAIAHDLASLQDKIAPFENDVARKAVERAFGKPINAMFSHFDRPIAAASIAQVHKAVTLGGQTVAVKVLRPGVARRFRRDLESFFFAARWLERLSPEARRLRPVEVVSTLARSVELEMDFRLEAAAMSEMAENIVQDEGFSVPAPHWQLVTKSVMAIDWVDGIPLSDLDAVRAAGNDLTHLGAEVIQHFLRHAVRDGFFHADMHQGNLFVGANGGLVAVDFGIMGRLIPKERRFLAEILFGFITRNYRRVAEVHFEAAYVPDTQDVELFAQALRAIGEPLMEKTAEDISMARLLGQLLEVTDLFDMRTQPQLLLLQKTMVVVEGVARNLDPAFNMWTASEPVVRDWIESNLGPEGRLHDAAEGAQTLGRLVGALPDIMARAERTAERAEAMATDGLRLDTATVNAIASAQAKRTRFGRLALWIGAISLAAIAVGLLK